MLRAIYGIDLGAQRHRARCSSAVPRYDPFGARWRERFEAAVQIGALDHARDEVVESVGGIPARELLVAALAVVVAARGGQRRTGATAEYAEALNGDGTPVQVQESQPDGTSDWVTECVCMTPDDDLVLRAHAPAMQYGLLRNQILDAARQACLDRAIANDLDPDPPPATTAAVACPRSSRSTPKLAARGSTCTIGQPLIDAITSSPEAVLAEGTSLAFVSSDGVVVGMELRGVEKGNLAGRLGLRNGDVIVRVGELPLRSEAELLAAAEWASDVDEVTVVVVRDGREQERRFVRRP